jgi:hypothetical protein
MTLSSLPLPMKPLRFAASAAAVLGLCAGCAWYTVVPTFTKAVDYPQHPHKKEDILLLMAETVPTDPYYQVGQVEVTRSDWQGNEELFDAMRELGVKYGFDGISGIVCGPDYSTAYRCSGTAFVFK